MSGHVEVSYNFKSHVLDFPMDQLKIPMLPSDPNYETMKLKVANQLISGVRLMKRDNKYKTALLLKPG